jgi:hypothetical protein
MRNWNLFKLRISEICLKQIRVNQEIGVLFRTSSLAFFNPKKFRLSPKFKSLKLILGNQLLVWVLQCTEFFFITLAHKNIQNYPQK